MTDLMHRVGLRVCLFRERLTPAMSQADLAARVGLSQPDISKLERGKVRSITLRRLELLATALDVSVAALVADDVEEPLPPPLPPAVLRLVRVLAACPPSFVAMASEVIAYLHGLQNVAGLSKTEASPSDRTQAVETITH